MLSVNELQDPLIEKKGRVYKKRWVMLTLFVLVSTMQCTVWMTYMAVPDTSIAIYSILIKKIFENINYIFNKAFNT